MIDKIFKKYYKYLKMIGFSIEDIEFYQID